MTDLTFKPRSRIEWIDIAKGFCILFVVIGHFSGWVDSFFANGTDTITSHIVNLFNPLRMPLFFLISGYLAQKHYRGSLRENSPKTLGLFLIYIFWETALYFRPLISNIANFHLREYLSVIFLPGILWFIWALPVFYMLAWINYKILQKYEYVILIPLIYISLDSLDVTRFIFDVFHVDNKTLDATLNKAIWFFCGLFFKDFWNAIIANSSGKKFMISIIIFVTLSEAAIRFDIMDTARTVLAPVALYTSAQLLGIINPSNWIAKIFARIGRDTLPVYVLHLAIGPTLMKSMSKISFLTSAFNNYPVILLNLIPILLAVSSVFLFRIIGRLVIRSPFKSVFHPIDLRHRHAAPAA